MSDALTFGEGFLEAFAVNVPQDVMRLPVEVSEGQLTEELIAGKQTRRHQKTHYTVRISNKLWHFLDNYCHYCK